MEVKVNPKRLQAEATWLMNCCFFTDGHHWSTSPKPRPKKYAYAIVRVAYLRRIDWFGFIFSKYHPRAIAVFQDLPISKRHFFQYVNDRYKRFNAWLIAGKHFDTVLSQLQLFEEIKLEFIVQPANDKLVIPKPFEKFNLTFYERGKQQKKSC
jgi:hypothetical protein